MMENPIEMDDLGVPLFLETPISKSIALKKLRPPPFACGSIGPALEVKKRL